MPKKIIVEDLYDNRVVFVGDPSKFKNSQHIQYIYYGVKGTAKKPLSHSEAGGNRADILFRPFACDVWFPCKYSELKVDE